MEDAEKQNEKAIVNTTIRAIIKAIEKAKKDNLEDQRRIRSNTDGMQTALRLAYDALERIESFTSRELK